MRPEIKSLDDLFFLAGNAALFAGKLNVHQFTVERWREQGIPKKYRIPIVELFNISLAELDHLDRKLRSKKAA